MLTLLEPVRLPPTLPPGFGSLDTPCPGQEVPLCPRQQGSWTHQVGEEPVDVMFLPRNGKAGMFLGKEQSTETSRLGTSTPPSPPPRALPFCAGPHGVADTLQRWPGLPPAPAHLSTHTWYGVAHIHKYPHSPTHTHTHNCSQELIHTSTPTGPPTHLCSLVRTYPQAPKSGPHTQALTYRILDLSYTLTHTHKYTHIYLHSHTGVDIHEHICIL